MAEKTGAGGRRLTGGCQCGAVRYALARAPVATSICWCRMCQKAGGNYMMAFSRVALADLTWTRAEPGLFRSSPDVQRHFCGACGTPLTYRYVPGGNISVSSASLDDPSAAPPPSKQYFPEGRPAFVGTLCSLEEVPGSRVVTPETAAGLKSLQHPDRES